MSMNSPNHQPLPSKPMLLERAAQKQAHYERGWQVARCFAQHL